MAVAVVGGLAIGLAKHSGSSRPISPVAVVSVIAGVVILLIAIVVWASWLYRRPNYRRVFQYSRSRRAEVGKKLRKGVQLAADDLPVARAIVGFTAGRRWGPFGMGVPAVAFFAAGLTGHGFSRYMEFVVAGGYFLLAITFFTQNRKMQRNFARQLGPGKGAVEP